VGAEHDSLCGPAFACEPPEEQFGRHASHLARVLRDNGDGRGDHVRELEVVESRQRQGPGGPGALAAVNAWPAPHPRQLAQDQDREPVISAEQRGHRGCTGDHPR
jgi:hypothetical protein